MIKYFTFLKITYNALGRFMSLVENKWNIRSMNRSPWFVDCHIQTNNYNLKKCNV
jgi:DNA-directed RNA polymerase delta subunit